VKARLLIVNGRPASGKSTLAPLLCSRLRLPLIGKDTIKEAMGDALGTRSVDDSVILGRASYPVLYALVRAQLLLGVSVAMEAPFSSPASDRDLGSLTRGAVAGMVFCEAPAEVLQARARARAAGRHAVHRELDRLARAGTDGPASPFRLPDLAMPVLRVDARDGYEPPLEGILRWIRTTLSLPDPG
jgi:glucokinase